MVDILLGLQIVVCHVEDFAGSARSSSIACMYTKSFKIRTQFQIVCNLCTACSGTHSLIPHTYTATYTLTQLHTYMPAQVYAYKYRMQCCVSIHIQYVGTWMYIYTYMNVCTVCIRVCTLDHGIIRNLLVAWDVILGHVGGFVSESTVYTCMAFQTSLKPCWLAMTIVRTVIWPE